MTTIIGNSAQITIVDLAYDSLISDIAHWQSMVQTNTNIYDLAFLKFLLNLKVI